MHWVTELLRPTDLFLDCRRMGRTVPLGACRGRRSKLPWGNGNWASFPQLGTSDPLPEPIGTRVAYYEAPLRRGGRVKLRALSRVNSWLAGYSFDVCGMSRARPLPTGQNRKRGCGTFDNHNLRHCQSASGRCSRPHPR